MSKPPGLSIELDLEETIEELSKAPIVSKNGTVYAGKVMISTTSCTLGGQTMTLDPSELVPIEGDSLGRGSSGCVRKVRHSGTGQILALKEIKISSEHHLIEIQKELETLHQGVATQHENLIDFYGAYSQEGCVYIAMECMTGSMADLSIVPEPILAKMTKMVLKGLQYLHSTRHLIHRDIKPSNLLYEKETGCVKITDFGVSSQLENTHGCAVSFVGTVTYMSPERLKGDAHGSVGDIWSLGISLLELAIGAHPYKTLLAAGGGGGNEAKFWSLLSHLNSSQQTVTLPESCSPEFKSFIEQCCEKDPSKRPGAKALLDHPWVTANCVNEEADKAAVKQWLNTDARTKKDSAPVAAPPTETSKAKSAENSAKIRSALDNLVDIA